MKLRRPTAKPLHPPRLALSIGETCHVGNDPEALFETVLASASPNRRLTLKVGKRTVHTFSAIKQLIK